MSDAPLVAHSLAEAYLYLLVTPCPSCGKGPLYARDARITRTEGVLAFATVPGTCGACGATGAWSFQVPAKHLRSAAPDDVINDTDEPSGIIDVGQWIMLSRMIVEAASRSGDKLQVRRFGIEASHCLAEALKFYEAGSDTPPEDTFFTAISRERFRKTPEQFSRRRLLDLRSKLPAHPPKRR